MKPLLICTTLLVLLFHTVKGQVVDVAPRGYQDYLPVEGGGIRMKIDKTTSLDSLLLRLNTWQFIETGKGYWIGYTNDMFSIAARGDTAIQPLINLAEKSSNMEAREGAIYTLHLIGINRDIVGRFGEEFVNAKCRKALQYLLKYPELRVTIMELLIRDPWFSDVPAFFGVLRSSSTDCWSVINGLLRYELDKTPVCQPIPDSTRELIVNIKYTDPLVLEYKYDFEEQAKEILDSIDHQYKNIIFIEKTLFENRIWGPMRTKFGDNLENGKFGVSIGEFLYSMARVDYIDIGNQIEYYMENGKLFICSPQTARIRWMNWWENFPTEKKKTFEREAPVWRSK